VQTVFDRNVVMWRTAVQVILQQPVGWSILVTGPFMGLWPKFCRSWHSLAVMWRHLWL